MSTTAYRPEMNCREFPLSIAVTGEPTSGLETLTCSLRVRGQWLLVVARACEPRIGNGFSFPVLPTIAGHCIQVRVKWGQQCVDSASPVVVRVSLTRIGTRPHQT
jgi:hypothetical protein